MAKIEQELTYKQENGIAQPSFALNMLQEMRQYTDDVKEEERIDEDDIKGAGVLMFAAGHDTVSVTLIKRQSYSDEVDFLNDQLVHRKYDS